MSELYGTSAVAQRFVVLYVPHAAVPDGQGCGTGSVPRFCAPEHASFAGGAPVQFIAHGPPPALQATHEIVADQPAPRTVMSDENLKVRQPLVLVIVPGLVVPW